jgi:hypothetical protein
MRLLSWLRQRTNGQPTKGAIGKHRPAPRWRPRLEALEDRWLPSTLTVLNTNDSGPGSLRAEIAAAQSGDTIDFDPSLAGQIINLTSGELAINKSLTIDGSTAGFEWLQSNGASRIFDITTSSANVTFIKLLTAGGGGVKDGGDIMNMGSLTMHTCSLVEGTASHHGGAVENQGTMFINDSVFDSNQAADGGAIENDGAMTITGGRIEFNFAGPVPGFPPHAPEDGGGIENRGTLSVRGCFFSAAEINAAYGFGGDIANFGTLNVTSSFFGGQASDGGSIANFGSATLDSSSVGGRVFTFLGSPQGQAGLGGGIYNAGTLTVSASILGGSADVAGGGIYNAGTLTINASKVVGDAQVAGGGIYNTGTLYVTNGSVVSGSSAPAGADLYNLGTVVISSDSTVGVIGP